MYPHLRDCLNNLKTEEERANNYFHVYIKPDPRYEYMFVTDLAEGLNRDGGRDFQSGSIWNVNTWEQCAQLHGHWPVHLYAQMAMELCYYYDDRGCLLISERNNEYGGAFIEAIVNGSDYPIGNYGFYVHEDEKYGWPTNTKTRGIMLSSGAKLFHDGSVTINSLRTIEEFYTFIEKENRKIEAVSGSFDDCVLEYLIAAAYLEMSVPQYIAPAVGGGEKAFAGSYTTGMPKDYAPPGYISLPK